MKQYQREARSLLRRVKFEREHPEAIRMKNARMQVMERFKCGDSYAHKLIHSGELPLKITRLNPRVVYVEAIDCKPM